MELIIFTGSTAAVIALELIAGVFFLSRGKKSKKNEECEEESKNNLLCRFVMDGTGKKVGESVALAGDIMIIKSGVKYLGVPMKHIEEEGKTLLVKGLIDHDKAEEMGEQWRRDSFKEIKDLEGKKDGF